MSVNIHPGFDTDNWCRTSQGDTAKKSFTWTIEGFINRPEEHGEFIESASFCIIGPDDKTTEWKIRVYPKGYMSNPDPAIFLKKSCKGENSFEITANITLSVVNIRKEKCQTMTNSSKKFDSNKRWHGWRYRFLENESELLPDGNLTIFCEVTIFGPEKTVSGSKFPEENISRRDNCRKQVSEDFGTMLHDMDFSDFKIECGDRSFDCHKNVLSARSPVLKAMLKADMKENTSNKLIITDVVPAVIDEMLHFIYTGNVRNGFISEKVASDLLGTADKYQLD